MTQEQRERQKKAMDRLTGANRTNVPKVPVTDKKIEPPRGSSQNRGGSGSVSKYPAKGGSMTKPGVTAGGKKDNAKDLLLKMKEIKAHYNSQANRGNASKPSVNKISEPVNNNNL